MKETDDHFSAAQLDALKRRGIPVGAAAWRRVRMAIRRGISIKDDPALIVGHAERQPMCPIIDSSETADLVVLPDGSERWIQGRW